MKTKGAINIIIVLAFVIVLGVIGFFVWQNKNKEGFVGKELAIYRNEKLEFEFQYPQILLLSEQDCLSPNPPESCPDERALFITLGNQNNSRLFYLSVNYETGGIPVEKLSSESKSYNGLTVTKEIVRETNQGENIPNAPNLIRYYFVDSIGNHFDVFGIVGEEYTIEREALAEQILSTFRFTN